MFYYCAGGLRAEQNHGQEERGRGRRSGSGSSSSRRNSLFNGGAPASSRRRGGRGRQPHPACCSHRWGLFNHLTSRNSPSQPIRDQCSAGKGISGGRSSCSRGGGARCTGGRGGCRPRHHDAARQPPFATGHRSGSQQVSRSPGGPLRCGQLLPSVCDLVYIGLVYVLAPVHFSSTCFRIFGSWQLAAATWHTCVPATELRGGSWPPLRLSPGVSHTHLCACRLRLCFPLCA
jgi:hypothetical protein